MNNAKRLLIGFIVAIILGGGGGFALGPLAARERLTSTTPPSAPMRAAQSRVTIESIRGNARVLTPSGQWRIAREGETLERPTGLRTDGPESSITVFHGGIRVIAQHDARVMLGQSAGAMAVELDAGDAVVHSSSGRIKVMVPTAQAIVSGDAFGVWSRKDQTLIAVLDGEISLDTPVVSTKFAAGREIVLNGGGATPQVLAPQLRIDGVHIEKAGAKYQVQAKTSPNAIVYAKRGAHYEEVPLAAYGAFTTTIDGPRPAEGELLAYDAAGRRAQVDRPSETLERVLAAISKGAAAVTKRTEDEVQPVAETPPPKPKAAEPEKKSEFSKLIDEPKPKETEKEKEKEKEKEAVQDKEPAKKKKKKKEGIELHGDHVPKPVSLDLNGSGDGSEEKEQAAPKKEAPKKDKDEGSDEEKGIELEWGQ